MTFSLPALPYALDALEPHISRRTVEFHYGKHHAGYVDKLNELLTDGDVEEIAQGVDSLESRVRTAARARAIGDAADATALFNNAAQAWNHDFYWKSMSPNGGGSPAGAFAERLEAAFGSFDAFAKAFEDAAVGNFGSGWTWLVHGESGIEILNTDDADTPIARSIVPLLVIDVWEHAYYLDRQNDRASYVKAWFEHLANWEFAAANLG